MEDASKNLLQNFAANILRVKLERAAYMTTFLVVDYFSVKALVRILFIYLHVNSDRCID